MSLSALTAYDRGIEDERDRILGIILEDDWSGESLVEDRDNLFALIWEPFRKPEQLEK